MLWLWKGTPVNTYFFPFAAVTSCFIIGLIASRILPGQANTDQLTIRSLRPNKTKAD